MMVSARSETDTSRRKSIWKSPVAVLAGYAILLTAAGIGLTSLRPVPAGRIRLCLLLVEIVALGVGAPFLWAVQRDKIRPEGRTPNQIRPEGRTPNRGGWRAAILGILLPLLGIEVLTVAACAVFAGRPDAALCHAQVFLLSFALLLMAAAALFASLHIRTTTAQLLATLLALAMIGNVLYGNTFIEKLTAERSRPAALSVVLWTNPWMIVAGSILQEDPLRATELYNWSVVKYYGFDYPGNAIDAASARTLLVAGSYAAVALVLWGISGVLRRVGTRK